MNLTDWMNLAAAAAAEIATDALGMSSTRWQQAPGARLPDDLWGVYIPLMMDGDSVQIGLLGRRDVCAQLAKSLLGMSPDEVLDDDEWEASLGNLAALTRLGGRVVVSDWDDADHDQQFGTYMLARARNRYEGHFPARGLRYDGFTPYRFRASRVGLHCATRVS